MVLISKDVAYCICKCINDFETFKSFALVNKNFAKACHILQKKKKRQFKKFVCMLTNGGIIIREAVGVFTLPNGSFYPNRFVQINENGWVIITKTFIYTGSYNLINRDLGELCKYKDLSFCAKELKCIQREHLINLPF